MEGLLGALTSPQEPPHYETDGSHVNHSLSSSSNISGQFFVFAYVRLSASGITVPGFISWQITETINSAASLAIRRYTLLIINRPGVAGAVLQTPPLLINSVSQSVSQSSFVEISSAQLHSQTVRARDFKF